MTLNNTPANPTILDTLATTLIHHNPNKNKQHITDDMNIIHTHLTIIDLKTKNQPLYKDNKLALITNTEIYNYVKLRESINNMAFITASNCKTPLPLYRHHNLDYTNHLHNMYTITLHDPTRKQLVLNHDPFDIKPLYYTKTTRKLTFTSKPRTLVATKMVMTTEHPNTRNKLLQLQFSTGHKTLLTKMIQVLPKKTLIIENKHIVNHQHLKTLPKNPPKEIEENPALTQLNTTLENNVHLHQHTDVPYNIFLSNNIDSSVLLAMITQMNKTPIQTFTINFPESGTINEHDHAHHLTKLTNTEHVKIKFTKTNFWDLLPHLTLIINDPVTNYTILPTYKLTKYAAAQKLKIMLNNKNKNELFTDYKKYQNVLHPL